MYSNYSEKSTIRMLINFKGSTPNIHIKPISIDTHQKEIVDAIQVSGNIQNMISLWDIMKTVKLNPVLTPTGYCWCSHLPLAA